MERLGIQRNDGRDVSSIRGFPRGWHCAPIWPTGVPQASDDRIARIDPRFPSKRALFASWDCVKLELSKLPASHIHPHLPRCSG